MLSDQEKAVLRIIADNKLLFDTVQKVLQEQFDFEDKLDVGLSDNELGQLVRTRLVGVQKVVKGFQEISRYKSTQPEPEKTNQAR